MKKYGLDFGTTNSSIAIEENGVGRVLEIDSKAIDKRVIRSMLYFPKRQIVYSPKIPKARILNQAFMKGDFWYEGDSNPRIGQIAIDTYLKENINRHPGIIRRIYTGRLIHTRTLQEIKGGSDAIREFYEEIDYGTGRLLQALKTALKSPLFKGTTIFGEFYSLEQLIELFVGEIKHSADSQLGESIDELICGRPVRFSDDPKKDKAAESRLEDALKRVGFKKITFQYEPIAAAQQFLASSNRSQDKRVLVFDFGGGTLDTAIVTSGENAKVLAADGVYIGGDLLNSDIFEHKLWDYFGADATWGEAGLAMPRHIYESVRSWFSIPQLNNPETLNLIERLKYKNTNKAGLDRFLYFIKMNLGFEVYEAIEKAKKQLSITDEAVISYQNGPIDIQIPITQYEFEEIIMPRVEEVKKVVLRTMKTANVTAAEIDLVVRTGGSSLIPIFNDLLVDIFGKEKITQFETFTSIAGGLALHSEQH